MAYQRYQGYQYETSPRKLQPEYEPKKNPYVKKKSSVQKVKKVSTSQKSKKQIKPKAKLVITIAIGFLTLFAICYQNSLITVSFNEKEELKKNLSAIQKENEQLKVNIEKTLNLNNVELAAKEKLGMQKLDTAQKVYISLPKKDYIESAADQLIIEEDASFIDQILNWVKSII